MAYSSFDLAELTKRAASDIDAILRGERWVNRRSSRFRDTGLVHKAPSGEREVPDFIGFQKAARQSLPLRHIQLILTIFFDF